MDKSQPSKTICIIGRLRGITAKRLASLASACGHSLTRSLRSADLIVLAHSSVAGALNDAGFLQTPLNGHRARLVSEGSVRRLLGLDQPASVGPYHAADLSRVSGLSPEAVASLALFDLFEGSVDAYTFGDLATSKRIAKWLSQGYTVPEVIPALHRALLRGEKAIGVELARLGNGQVGTTFGGALVDLHGQIGLPLGEDLPDLDQIFDEAFAAEQEGDLPTASRLYETAARIDPYDAVIKFNHANVLTELGSLAEAEVAYRKALALEPAFSEAWFNLGLLAEKRALQERAKQAYRYAVVSDPANHSAKHNLARLLTAERAYAESIVLWDELAKEGSAENRREARKWATLCRLQTSK